jgi:16S rRNA (guanine527-N7)-methyltransferase
MDAGTGGGFPGIPLAILFPETEFTLTDSIGKKIKVIEAVKSELNLLNVKTRNERFENIRNKFEFITGRAVSDLHEFHRILYKNIMQKGINTLPPGILYLSGGDITEKISQINAKSSVWNLSGFFDQPYFESKKLIHLF